MAVWGTGGFEWPGAKRATRKEEGWFAKAVVRRDGDGGTGLEAPGNSRGNCWWQPEITSLGCYVQDLSFKGARRTSNQPALAFTVVPFRKKNANLPKALFAVASVARWNGNSETTG